MGTRGTLAPRRGVPVLAAVFALALANRLVPVLRGGGLSGVIGYDDAVYYAGAVGLVHGRLPYRDFLFLHPPGVLVALAPVAGLGRIVGETTGWEISRLAWMIMGSLTATIVAVALLPLGRLAAAVGGGAYAIFPAAVLVERTTLVEGLTSLCLAAALALVIQVLRTAPTGPGIVGQHTLLILAGAGGLLGFATAVKIWGIVPLVTVTAFVGVVRGGRAALSLVAGAAAVIIAVCLPFFLMAPDEMWGMVVLDQLGRDQDTALLGRAAQLATMGRVTGGGSAAAVAIGAVAVAVGSSVLVWRVTVYRLVVPLTLGLVVLLLLTPIFYPHYVAVLAVPASLTAGVLASLAPRPGSRPVIIACAAVVLLLDATAVALIRSGAPVPAELRPPVQAGSGCLTSDDPNNLLALGVVGRNLDRGCVLVVDLGGYSHHLSRGQTIPRSRNSAWQRLGLDYLGSGEQTLATRFDVGRGYSKVTAAEIASWPVVVRIGTYELREPPRQR